MSLQYLTSTTCIEVASFHPPLLLIITMRIITILSLIQAAFLSCAVLSAGIGVFGTLVLVSLLQSTHFSGLPSSGIISPAPCLPFNRAVGILVSLPHDATPLLQKAGNPVGSHAGYVSGAYRVSSSHFCWVFPRVRTGYFVTRQVYRWLTIF